MNNLSTSGVYPKCGLLRYLGLLALSVLALQSIFTPAWSETQAEGTTPPSAASETDSKANTRPGINTQHLQLQQLAASINPKEVLWLNGRQGDVTSVLALYLPANRAQAQGAVLLLHDEGQHPDWPGVVKTLRESLPDAGWHTLSLALSYPQAPSPPKRVLLTRSDAQFPYVEKEMSEAGVSSPGDSGAMGATAEDVTQEPADNNEKADSQGNELSPEELAQTNQATTALEQGTGAEQNVDVNAQDNNAAAKAAPEVRITNNQRISFGLAQLEGFGLQNRVVLGVGRGAEVLVRFLIANPDLAQSLQGFVFIDAEFDQSLLVELKEAAPGFLEQKVLDLYDSTREDLSSALASRLAFSKRNGMKRYRQDGLAGGSLLANDSSSQYQNRIRGWLQRQAPGMNYSSKAGG